MTSTDKFIFEKLEAPIIHSIAENEYYGKVKTTNYSNLISKRIVLERTMQELDSLRDLYKQVLLIEGAREESGTNIYMAETGDRNKEVLVIDKYVEVNEEMIGVNEKLTEVMEVVNVVSNFNSVGMKVKGWNKNFTFLGAALGFILLFAYLAIRKINEALVAIETRKRQV